MLDKTRGRLTYANVMSTVAVFLALGGGVAWALTNNSVKSKHIVNEQVKAVDIADAEELPADQPEDAVNATGLGGHEDEVFLRSAVLATDPNAREVRYRAYSLDTSTTGSSFQFGTSSGGGMAIENVGTADKFRVCNVNAAGSVLNASVYVGATRSQVSIPLGMCSADFTIPDDGDFSVSGNGAQVFGIFSSNSEDVYRLIGLEGG